VIPISTRACSRIPYAGVELAAPLSHRLGSLGPSRSACSGNGAAVLLLMRASNERHLPPETVVERPNTRDGEIVPDAKWSGMYRIKWRAGGLSDMINYTRASAALRGL
jgi:hypothetical protein